MRVPPGAAGSADISHAFRSRHRYPWCQLQPAFQLAKKSSVILQPCQLKKILLLFL